MNTQKNLSLSSSCLTRRSIGNEIRINNETMLSGFSGRADACRRMTGEENACCRMTEEENACRRMTEEENAYRRMTLSGLSQSGRSHTLSPSGSTGGSIKTMNSSLLDSPIKSGNDRGRMDSPIKSENDRKKVLSPSTTFLSFPRRRESIKHYCRLFILMCVILITLPTKAEITETPCANGNGYIVKGNISGEYCSGKIFINYWNAVAWCDAIGMQPADMTDCVCTIATDCSGRRCPNFAGMVNNSNHTWWLNTPSSETHQWSLNTNSGGHYQSWDRMYGAYSLCKSK